MENRNNLLQTMILHDAIGKRIPALQQIMEGMKILGIHSIIAKNPSLFEAFFIHQEENLTAERLLQQLKFDNTKEINPAAYHLLHQYITETSKKPWKDECN